MPDSGNLKQTLGYPQFKLQESQLKISMLYNVMQNKYDIIHERMKGFVSVGIHRLWKHCKWA